MESLWSLPVAIGNLGSEQSEKFKWQHCLDRKARGAKMEPRQNLTEFVALVRYEYDNTSRVRSV